MCLHSFQAPPSPAVINADLFARQPDNIRLLFALLEEEPVGVDDFYVRYYALQTLGALLTACPDRLQVAAAALDSYMVLMQLCIALLSTQPSAKRFFSSILVHWWSVTENT